MVVDAWQLRCLVYKTQEPSGHCDDFGVEYFDHFSKRNYGSLQKVNCVSRVSLELNQILSVDVVVFAELVQEVKEVRKDIDNQLFFINLFQRVRLKHILPNNA